MVNPRVYIIVYLPRYIPVRTLSVALSRMKKCSARNLRSVSTGYGKARGSSSSSRGMKRKSRSGHVRSINSPWEARRRSSRSRQVRRECSSGHLRNIKTNYWEANCSKSMSRKVGRKSCSWYLRGSSTSEV